MESSTDQSEGGASGAGGVAINLAMCPPLGFSCRRALTTQVLHEGAVQLEGSATDQPLRTTPRARGLGMMGR